MAQPPSLAPPGSHVVKHTLDRDGKVVSDICLSHSVTPRVSQEAPTQSALGASTQKHQAL